MYHLYNLCEKSVRNNHEGMLLLVKLQTETCDFFSMFFKFNKWYQIAQSASYAKSFNHKHELLGYLNFVYVHHFFKVKRRISEILAGLIWFNCFEMALVWTKNKRKAKAPYFSQIKRLCAWKILPCYARDKIFCLGLLSYWQFLVRKVYWHER